MRSFRVFQSSIHISVTVAARAPKFVWQLALVGVSLRALTLCCGVKIIRLIRVQIWKVFLNIPGTVWSTAKKLCMRIDIIEGHVLVVKNL